MREYNDLLTVDVNSKGVLDVDTVKGCTMGIKAHGEKGCYQGCYAAKIAKYRGIDFSVSVSRKVRGKNHAKAIEKSVSAAPQKFFRVGTMGDPCHDWDETVDTIQWLSQFARPVVITKHWIKASDEHLAALRDCGTIINTSISALDNKNQLRHRESQIERYRDIGGNSISRVVSCDFNKENEAGAKLAEIQSKIMKKPLVIDNPLRVESTHDLVKSGIIKTRKVIDLIAVRDISIPETSNTYLGHCIGCHELCGVGMQGVELKELRKTQLNLFT